MNYRHSFHAGNFADCLKHAVLLELLRALTEKETPISYIETHGGRGAYLLASDTDIVADRNAEWPDGIGKLMEITGLPPELHRYVERVKSFNHGDTLLRYPGSPLLAAARLRQIDKLTICELESEEARLLEIAMGKDARVRVIAGDGYAALKALLPPTPKRGMVLIDPPYEAADEFLQIQQALTNAMERWATGVYVIWYPIKVGRELAPFYRGLKALPAKSVLTAELCVHPDESALRLNGSGMAIINAPYQFDLALQRLVKPLHRMLRHETRARAKVDWLVAPS